MYVHMHIHTRILREASNFQVQEHIVGSLPLSLSLSLSMHLCIYIHKMYSQKHVISRSKKHTTGSLTFEPLSMDADPDKLEDEDSSSSLSDCELVDRNSWPPGVCMYVYECLHACVNVFMFDRMASR